MTALKPLEILHAQNASDGAGVKLKRVFGGRGPERFDPFLMLDEFGSNEASDYIGGFPAHPHRGFETITYMLQGKMEHRDHMDNVGLLNDGDVQWMTAGRGVIHSEMPRQTEGQMRGFQLWLNLPAASKMTPADYADVAAADIPVFEGAGFRLKAIAGEAAIAGQSYRGYFTRPDTQPILWDLHLAADSDLELALPATHNALVYVYQGAASVAGSELKAQQLMRLSRGERLSLGGNNADETRLLVIAGRPLGEPIVQYGPFVMNKVEEIEQALADYREGKLTA